MLFARLKYLGWSLGNAHSKEGKWQDHTKSNNRGALHISFGRGFARACIKITIAIALMVE